MEEKCIVESILILHRIIAMDILSRIIHKFLSNTSTHGRQRVTLGVFTIIATLNGDQLRSAKIPVSQASHYLSLLRDGLILVEMITSINLIFVPPIIYTIHKNAMMTQRSLTKLPRWFAM